MPYGNLRIENGVLIGKNGELFLANGNHNPINFALGKVSVSNDSVNTFWKNIQTRSTYCQSNNILYRHIVFPDKHIAQPKNFPLGPVPGLFDRYTQESSKNYDVLYPLKALRDSNQPTFHSDDTHMNTVGNVIVLNEILTSLYSEFDIHDFINDLDKLKKTVNTKGDLSSKFDDKPREVEIFSAPKSSNAFHNGVIGGNNGIADIYINDSATYNKQVLIFGDSFFRGILPVLSFFFQKILFLRTPFFHKEMSYLFSPDIIFTGNVERYMANIKSDGEASPFFLYRYEHSTEDHRNETPGFLSCYTRLLSRKEK